MRHKQSLHGAIPHCFLLFAGVGVITLPIYLIKRSTNYIEIGDKFIKSRTGLINKKTIETGYKRIDSVGIEKGLFGSIFNYGNITILSGSSRHVLKKVASPELIKSQIEDKL